MPWNAAYAAYLWLKAAWNLFHCDFTCWHIFICMPTPTTMSTPRLWVFELTCHSMQQNPQLFSSFSFCSVLLCLHQNVCHLLHWYMAKNVCACGCCSVPLQNYLKINGVFSFDFNLIWNLQWLEKYESVYQAGNWLNWFFYINSVTISHSRLGPIKNHYEIPE